MFGTYLGIVDFICVSLAFATFCILVSSLRIHVKHHQSTILECPFNTLVSGTNFGLRITRRRLSNESSPIGHKRHFSATFIGFEVRISILSTFSTNSSSSEYSDSSTFIRFLLIGKDSSEDVELEESVSLESSPSE